MERHQRVGTVVLAAEERTDTHILDVFFRGGHHLVKLGDKLLFARLLDEIDDLARVVQRFSALFVRADLALDGRDLPPDLCRAFEILPDGGVFLFLFEFFELLVAVVDIKRVLRLAERLFQIFDF